MSRAQLYFLFNCLSFLMAAMGVIQFFGADSLTHYC